MSQVAFGRVDQISEVASHQLGDIYRDSFGRCFVYAKAGATALVRGKLTVAADPVANHLNMSFAVAPTKGDTKIQLEESADEDKIRIDIAGTETAIFGDGTNEALLELNNDSTNHGLYLHQDGVLASSKYGLYVYSDAIQNTSSLAKFFLDNSSSDQKVIDVVNDGSGHGVSIDQYGILAANRYALNIYSNAIQANSPLVNVHQDNSSSSSTVINFSNDGGGHGVVINQIGALNAHHHALSVVSSAAQTNSDTALLKITMSNASSTAPCLETSSSTTSDSIYDDSGAKLTYDGFWTNATCCHKDKIDVRELSVKGDFLNKLKNLKLFTFKSKRAVERAKDKAPTVMGYILDDPSTPEELIIRGVNGEIIGVSPAHGVNFLLAVCKELIGKIEKLEAKVGQN